MSRERSIEGFDYRRGRPRSLSAREWRQELDAVLGDGGWRRVEQGETFAHARDGALQFEAYAAIRPTRERTR